jgi:hypothetical protein
MTAVDAVADTIPPRQCGRCRLSFEGDPTLDPEVQAEWWLCPRCREALLGRGQHS